MPDGNFQDYVVLSQDTLSHRGAEVRIGGATVSTAHLGMSNSAGRLDLQAVPTGNGTVNFPTSGGTLLTNVNLSAGTTSNNLSAWVYSNSNNVSFGLNGSTVTATATVASSQGSVNLSAGTTSNLASAFTFSNSNGVSFGLNASTITASVATSLTNVNVSAGTTSNNLSAVTFSNSNGVSFGLNASTITASVATSLTNVNVSAGTTSNNLSAITFSNSNGVSFGLNGSTLTGSVATSLTNINVSAGTTSNNLSAVTFSNSNLVSFGLNGSTITASVGGIVDLAAGTQTATSGTVILSNSNGISFGMSGSATVTAALGGISSFAQGFVVSSYGFVNNAVPVFTPLTVQHNMTVTNILSLASFAVFTNSSGALTVTHALYTVNGNTLSLASSASRQISYTSGAGAGQAIQVSGVQYRSVTVASWALTPGIYVLAQNISTAVVGVTLFGSVSQYALASAGASLMTNMVLAGVSASSTGALPSSIAISDTANYIRSGDVQEVPYFIFQGT